MQDLISHIDRYSQNNPSKKYTAALFLNLLETHSQSAFSNTNWDGHITASMLITNPEKTKVLLMFHKKLQKWLQFGGHSDGDSDTLATAIREFHEESGIIVEPTIYTDIFNIDIHHIPADLKGRPAHKHYDILYLGTLSEDTPFARQESEVDEIRWFDIDGIEEYIHEERMLSMLGTITERYIHQK